MAKQPRATRVACPEGHTDGLQLRVVADAPIRLVDAGDLHYLEPVLVPGECVEVVDVEGQPGVDGGVWCPTCDEWFEADACIHRSKKSGKASA